MEPRKVGFGMPVYKHELTTLKSNGTPEVRWQAYVYDKNMGRKRKNAQSKHSTLSMAELFAGFGEPGQPAPAASLAANKK